LPTGESEIIGYEPRKPGKGKLFTLEWPKRFDSTDSDDQAAAGTMVSSTGGKAFVSQRTAVESWAKRTGRDPQEEWKRIEDENRRKKDEELGMFPSTGGAVGGGDVTRAVNAPTEETDAQEGTEEGQDGAIV